MKTGDYVVIAIVIILVVLALVVESDGRKKGKGCSGDCRSCKYGKCEKDEKE